MKKFLVFFLISLLFTKNVNATKDINKIFPLNNYPQYLNFWFNENNKNYKTVYLSKEIQYLYFKILKNNYYGKNSPWSKSFIKYLISPEPITEKTIFKGQTLITNIYKNNINYPKETSNTLYGINFKRLESCWINKIIDNMNLAQFENLTYNSHNRAITVDQTIISSLPTQDPGFNNHKIAGSGYPFNLFNLSAIPAGMPTYILGTTKNKAWHFIVAPGVMGWVKANKIAYVNKSFINIWCSYANKNLANILTSNLSVIDTNEKFHFTAMSGTILPVYKSYHNKLNVMIPVKTSNNYAIIKNSIISKTHISIIPLPLTMENFAKVVKSLIGRPYGWGGINYYNDCSLELMAIYKAFGIFLTRNSASQATYSGQIIDISKLSETERKDMIIRNSIPFATLLYFKGHIMVYIGTYNTNYSNNTIMTYQNIWGLAPKDRSYRSIIGKSVIFPLLNNYLESPNSMSLISKNNFIIVNLIKPADNIIGLSNLLY